MRWKWLAGLALTGLVSSGADAEWKSPEVQQAESVIKMIIGLNHKRCAEITYVEKLRGSVYGVTCIRTAGRPARAHYAVDALNNAVVGIN